MTAPIEPGNATAAQILAAIRAKYKTVPILSEITVDTIGSPSRRIDGLMFDGLQRTAIEIKISKADATRETWDKVAPWRAITHRFIYVVPTGLMEYPPIYGCGIWEVDEDGVVTIKRKAGINKYPDPLPAHVITRIAYRTAGLSQINPG